MDFYRPPTTQGTIDALGCILRAVRAWKFYPPGHPTRSKSLNHAHLALIRILDGNNLLLACGRTGLSFPDGDFIKDTTGLTRTLAFELFVRRVQKITFMADLLSEDLLELVRLLCLTPEVIQQNGGVDAILTSRGVRTIWTNEFDLASIRIKRQSVEQSGIVPHGIEEANASGDTITDMEPHSPTDEESPGEQLQALLKRLDACTDGDIYPRLATQALACADELQARGETALILPLLELLASHAEDKPSGNTVQAHALFALEQSLASEGILQFVLGRIEHGDGLSDVALHLILKVGGSEGIRGAVEMLGSTSSLKTRKTLSTTLAGVGEPAVPVLLDLMHDSRWFIIRNICSILGTIGSRAALQALTKSASHSDIRVRKEAVRSLAQLGGDEAEAALIAILRGKDAALHPQIMASLGGMKSRRALPELLKILFVKDMFLKSLQTKLNALAAIALIGDRQVTPHLLALLEERHLLAAARGKQLKTAIVTCLGRTGDERALPQLAKLAADSGELGAACTGAINMIKKAEGGGDGIS